MSRDLDEYRGYRDLRVHQCAYQLAIDLYNLTKRFPIEEKYALTDQIRRSSRSVAANLAEALKKRRYEKAFISKLIDCAGESGETEVWIDFAKEFGYLTEDQHRELISRYDEVNRMLNGMINKPEKFCK